MATAREGRLADLEPEQLRDDANQLGYINRGLEESGMFVVAARVRDALMNRIDLDERQTALARATVKLLAFREDMKRAFKH